MMKKHLEQARHNEAFLHFLDTSAPDEYFDWKFTVLYYTALHYMRAFLKMKGLSVGSTHEDVLKCINPIRKRSPGEKGLAVNQQVYKAYRELYLQCLDARYEFSYFISPVSGQKVLYSEYRKSLEIIKHYLQKQGLEVE
jgi:hypothetical protein